MMKVYGVDPGVVLTSGRKGLSLFIGLSCMLFVLCEPFVFPVSILDPPGIDWCGQAFLSSILLFLDLPVAFLICLVWLLHVAFLVSSWGLTPFFIPWTSRSFVPLVLAWACVWIKYFPLSLLLLHMSKFLLFSKMLYVYKGYLYYLTRVTAIIILSWKEITQNHILTFHVV